MSQVVYVIVYLSLIVAIVMVIKRIIAYKSNPMHLRWELYPVAHEPGERANYGGSYLEDVDWWKKPRESSLMGELAVMVPEILFLKGVWEHNRSLWIVSFPFHFGLYLIIGCIGLIAIGAVGNLIGWGDSSLMQLVAIVASMLGPAGFALSLFGAIGLLLRRLGDTSIRSYSSFEHFYALALFIALMGVAIFVRLTVDPNFEMARGFLANLISFNLTQIDNSLFLIQILLACIVVAYIPISHMSHAFMKYFLYHDIRWEDKPNVNAPEIDKQVNEVLGYSVSWSAPHMSIEGKKTWAEIATYNPAAEPEKKKE